MRLSWLTLPELLACLLLISCDGLYRKTSTPGAPPNILWITVEDMSPRLGCYGDSLARTPNLDRLASQGMRFAHAFSVSGVCAPSRSALITGMYPTAVGTHHMRTTSTGEGLPTPYFSVPPPYVKTFTEYLRAAGYYCSNNVKTDYQFAPPSEPGQPVTAWDDSSRSAHWRNREEGQPFFAVFNSTRTHESKVWPDPSEEPVQDPSEVEVPPYYPDTPVVRADLARHYDNIARMDTWVGGILEELEADGLAGNTIVFFFSDHGDGLPRAKRWPYDSGIRVPLIVRWPGVLDPNSLNEQLVSFVDFGPTVLSLAGVPVPEYVQGRAFLGSQSEAPRQYIYAARDRMGEAYDRIRVVRDKRYKYWKNFEPAKPYVQPIPYRDRMPLMQELLRLNELGRLSGPQALWFRREKPVEELYDTVTDPHEIDNLAEEPEFGDVLVRMRRALQDWMDLVGDMGEIPEAEMVERMWPGHVQPATATPVIDPPGGDYDEPVAVSISCATPGGSIAYTLDAGEDPHWLLYTGTLTVRDSAVIRAKAIRYGYAESREATANFRFRPE